METVNEKAALVSFILDESGSMERIRQHTIEGFNDYINELKGDSTPTLLRLETFNSTGSKVPYMFEDVRKVDELTRWNFLPSARTPLLDAVGSSIAATEIFLKNSKGEPQVIVTIMTDGMENASREYTSSQIRKMIEDKKSQGWIFTYLGANHDAWHVGESMGIDRKHIGRFSATNPKPALARSAGETLNVKQLYFELQDWFTEEAPCPRCKSGKISKQRGGQYTCSNFPDCDLITRARPLMKPSCPLCDGLLFWVRRLQVFCGDEKCGYTGNLI
ncbi:hypothetical protein M1N56_06390 [Dehalococcoidia bacterium]|nr:hypothetical protein [Dehalococcoidia bacterium]